MKHRRWVGRPHGPGAGGWVGGCGDGCLGRCVRRRPTGRQGPFSSTKATAETA